MKNRSKQCKGQHCVIVELQVFCFQVERRWGKASEVDMSAASDVPKPSLSSSHLLIVFGPMPLAANVDDEFQIECGMGRSSGL